jgi:hypothetical protein
MGSAERCGCGCGRRYNGKRIVFGRRSDMNSTAVAEKRVLDDEIETYERHKPELLAKAQGKYVLIKGENIIGIYDTDNEAINQGYRQLGHVPFLARRIQEEPEIVVIGGSSFIIEEIPSGIY